MKTVAFALALLLGGTALAQTGAGSAAWQGDGQATAAWETEGRAATIPTPATPRIVQPGNSAPERDARGIAVISDPAVPPLGWNGTSAGEAMGGPLLDPATDEPAARTDYPACTATVTDHCLQTYERGRRG
ncbi:MAG TPA: hypothetical protein VHM92_08135 [Allosphingosinicella sp.]|nr:hypothetical protein [Allosphingosinicella sp.]